jgi:hypothetical protein
MIDNLLDMFKALEDLQRPLARYTAILDCIQITCFEIEHTVTEHLHNLEITGLRDTVHRSCCTVYKLVSEAVCAAEVETEYEPVVTGDMLSGWVGLDT